MEFDVITLAGKRAGKASASPMNPEATLIACKADQEAPVETKLQQFLAACKSFFSDPGSYPVTSEVDDDIDDDGDGAADYNAITTAIFRVSADISAASQIDDGDARSLAVKTAIDGFLAELDAFRISDEAEADVEDAEKSTTDNGDEMTEADKAAIKAEIEADLDAKVQQAVKAVTEPLNAKIAEQEEAVANATKAAVDAKAAADALVAEAETAKKAADDAKAQAEQRAVEAETAKKAAEDALADAVTKARSRKAAGGHDDSAPADPKAAFQTLVKENPAAKISDAVRVLMHGSPVTLPPQ